MCPLRNEGYKTYQTGFSFRRLGHAPGGRTCGYRGGGWGVKKKIPKFNQIWHVSYLHQWHMQRHNFFGSPPPGALGRGKKVKYHKISITKSIERFLNQTFCVFSQMKDIKNIRRDFHSIAWVMPQGWDLGVSWGVGGSKNFFPPNSTRFGV